MAARPPALSVTSRVGVGDVGQRLIESAVRRFSPATRLLTLDTVQWTAPGNHPRCLGPVLSGQDLAAMASVYLAPAKAAGGGATALLTGYLRSFDQVISLVGSIELNHPRIIVVDPVLGEDGALFVPEETANAVRDFLAPLAHFLLPNRTEAAFLCGYPPHEVDRTEPRELLGQLHLKFPNARGIAITGCRTPDGMGIHAFEGDKVVHLSHNALERDMHGAGDLFAGIVFAELLEGRHFLKILGRAAGLVAASMQRVEDGNAAGLSDAFFGV